MEQSVEFITQWVSDTECEVSASHGIYLSKDIMDALIDMSVEYDTLRFEGYMDGHHFVITSVYNECADYDSPQYKLTEDDIEEMYYHAFGPECITIRYE